MNPNASTKLSSKIYMGLVFFVLYIPILVLIIFSFNSTSSTGTLTGISLYWYKELFNSPDTFDALKNTLILALSASVVSTLLATAAAVGLDRMRNRFMKTAVNSLTNIPMMNPEIVTGISMMLLYVFFGNLLNLDEKLSFWTLFIAHVTFCLPYSMMSISPRVRSFDNALRESAYDLGCTPIQAFFKVELPNIFPGILTGFIMAFTLSIDDFVISYFTSGSDFQTLPLLIYSMTKKTVKPDIYALSTLIIAAVVVLLVLSNLVGSKEERTEAKRIAEKKKMAKLEEKRKQEAHREEMKLAAQETALAKKGAH